MWYTLCEMYISDLFVYAEVQEQYTISKWRCFSINKTHTARYRAQIHAHAAYQSITIDCGARAVARKCTPLFVFLFANKLAEFTPSHSETTLHPLHHKIDNMLAGRLVFCVHAAFIPRRSQRPLAETASRSVKL